MPNQRSTGKMPDTSVKSPERSALLRNKLAPDYPEAGRQTPTTNSIDSANGTLPGPAGVPGLIAVPVDNNRVPGQPGPPGPM